MFRKLHIQMTVFSAAITSAILVIMALVCPLIAESSAKENSYASFVNNAQTCISQLEEQPSISHRWLKAIICVSDNLCHKEPPLGLRSGQSSTIRTTGSNMRSCRASIARSGSVSSVSHRV